MAKKKTIQKLSKSHTRNVCEIKARKLIKIYKNGFKNMKYNCSVRYKDIAVIHTHTHAH